MSQNPCDPVIPEHADADALLGIVEDRVQKQCTALVLDSIVAVCNLPVPKSRPKKAKSDAIIEYLRGLQRFARMGGATAKQTLVARLKHLCELTDRSNLSRASALKLPTARCLATKLELNQYFLGRMSDENLSALCEYPCGQHESVVPVDGKKGLVYFCPAAAPKCHFEVPPMRNNTTPGDRLMMRMFQVIDYGFPHPSITRALLSNTPISFSGRTLFGIDLAPPIGIDVMPLAMRGISSVVQIGKVSWSGLTTLVTLHIVRSHTLESMIALVRDRDDEATPQWCKIRLCASFQNTDADLQIDRLVVSLRDPYLLTPVNLPARTWRCEHPDCFDLRTFLLSNARRPAWKCPICGRAVSLGDLYIDRYLATEIAEAPLPLESIVLKRDGSTEPVFCQPDHVDSEGASPPASPVREPPRKKQKVVDVIVLDDD